ncbi:MAG TPA: hypothetical protein VIX63_11805 [Vicinamibacterales bacterium]
MCRIHAQWLVVALLAAGLSPISAQQLLDRVVARVNGTPITLTDVNAALGLGLVEIAGGEDPQAAAARQLIERQLILAEVARFAPPEPDGAAIEREMAALKARAGAHLEMLMQSTGLDEQRIRDLAGENLRIQSYLNQRFGASLQVSDEEVEQYYRGHPEEFTRNGILVSYEDAAPVARQRASALRRSALIAQWLRDLRARAEVTTPQARP